MIYLNVKENTLAKQARSEAESHMSSQAVANRAGQQQQQAQSASRGIGSAQADGGGPNLTWLQTSEANNVAGFDIPIFTEEFIDHSKAREQEIRQLRKDVNEFEQQNSVLHKHIDSLKQSSTKIDADMEHYRNQNVQLQKNLDIFRQTMLQCFQTTPLPNTQECAQANNIDDYIMKMYSIVNSQNQQANNNNNNESANGNDQNRNFTMHVKSVISKFNFTTLFDTV